MGPLIYVRKKAEKGSLLAKLQVSTHSGRSDYVERPHQLAMCGDSFSQDKTLRRNRRRFEEEPDVHKWVSTLGPTVDNKYNFMLKLMLLSCLD